MWEEDRYFDSLEELGRDCLQDDSDDDFAYLGPDFSGEEDDEYEFEDDPYEDDEY